MRSQELLTGAAKRSLLGRQIVSPLFAGSIRGKAGRWLWAHHLAAPFRRPTDVSAPVVGQEFREVKRWSSRLHAARRSGSLKLGASFNVATLWSRPNAAPCATAQCTDDSRIGHRQRLPALTGQVFV